MTLLNGADRQPVEAFSPARCIEGKGDELDFDAVPLEIGNLHGREELCPAHGHEARLKDAQSHMKDSAPVRETLLPHANFEPCRVCGGELRPAFAGAVLGDVEVTYCICAGCHSLILPQPHWLARAYGPLAVTDPDSGLLQRTLFVHATLRRMRSVGLLPQSCRSLDHGAGKGVLVRLLLDKGFDAWGCEPIAMPLFAEERITRELPAGPFDLITSIEVVEHLLDPAEVLGTLRAALGKRGVLLLSTELFDEHRHGPEWHYLAPAHGQHVTLYSRDGLRMVAQRAGLRWVESLRWGGADFLHLLVHAQFRPAPWRLWWLRLRQQRGKWRARRDRYA